MALDCGEGGDDALVVDARLAQPLPHARAHRCRVEAEPGRRALPQRVGSGGAGRALRPLHGGCLVARVAAHVTAQAGQRHRKALRTG
ncbi:MAG: hypothetical protein U1F25_12440 [Rubrivivax sp.]